MTIYEKGKSDEHYREVLGTVILSDGRSVKVCMPLMGDLVDVDHSGNLTTRESYAILAKAIGFTLGEYLKLPLVDGVKIGDLVCTAIKRL